jgi:hypothetical protein
MNKEKLKPILTGIIKHIPGVKKILSKGTGGTIESRYCYSVWMRHLINWNTMKDGIPENVAELGPGDSLGIGLASLLSGSRHFYAFDVIKYWDNKRNLEIFEELIKLFRSKANIPDNLEYPKVKPVLENYNFPSAILSDQLLNETLADSRLNAIRKEIMDIDNPANSFIKYYIPWNESDIVYINTIDFIYSQAVLQHVEDLDYTYRAMQKWLKPSGLMSHTIDFKSMGVTESWNGHWTFNDFEWRIVKGGNIFLINREPISKHIELLFKYGFKLLINIPIKMENQLDRNQFSSKFKNLSEEDIITSGTYILAKKD